MSRLGKKIILIPEGVKVENKNGQIKVNGPRGELFLKLPPNISLEMDEKNLKVRADNNNLKTKALHGTVRALIANMVKGVSEGWSKKLELVGTGFRAETSGKKLVLNVGYSHPVEIEAPEGISFRVEKSEITVEGCDKELVGLIASRIRSVRPPEPYKGKGIKYKDEIIRRKAGKAAKAQGAA